MNNTQKALFSRAKELIAQSGAEALQPICELLKDNIHHYDWVGFYFMNDEKQKLEIGPFAGDRTPHTLIPYGTGICGQVAISGKPFLVPDVTQEENYLACSIKTKAELVMPIYKGDLLVGQIDIDSHHCDPFSKDDEKFLEKLCALTAKVL